MNDFTKIEAALLLEDFAIRRAARLSRIATERLVQGYGWFASDEDIIALEHENVMDDIAIRQYFLSRSVMSLNPRELHVAPCRDSLVEYCICLPNKQSQGQGEPL